LVRKLSSSDRFIWGDVIGTILSDFDTEDKEMQKNAFMTLDIFPLSESCEFLHSMEGTLLKYLEYDSKRPKTTPSKTDANDPEEDLQSKYYCLVYLPKFLTKTYLKMHCDEEAFTVKDIIKDLFKKIAEHMLHPNELISLEAMKGVQYLMERHANIENSISSPIETQGYTRKSMGKNESKYEKYTKDLNLYGFDGELEYLTKQVMAEIDVKNVIDRVVGLRIDQGVEVRKI
jgi:hypothetical protein